MVTWGVSFGSHDSSLAVFDDHNVVFASHGERFSKIKDDPDLPVTLIDHAVTMYGKPDHVFYYENPWKKRLRYCISGQWKEIFEELPSKTIANLGIDAPVSYVDHHHSHAAAGYGTSGFTDASVVVIDAIGEMTTASIWAADGRKLRQVYEQSYPHSIGLLYSALTNAAGFKPNGEEYILMGLAAYGNPDNVYKEIESEFVEFRDEKPIVKFRKNLHRGCGSWYNKMPPADIAAAAQLIYEKCLKHMLEWIWKNLPSKNLVLMGGCALNCVANSKIRQWHPWNDIWIMPNPGDAGSSIGAVIAGKKLLTRWPGPYLGLRIFGDYPVDGLLDRLKNRGIVGVANGPAEFGPRALGNRSLFADPRIPNVKDMMNWIKRREQFRPFAAVVPESLAPMCFDMGSINSSPYMQYVFKCIDPSRYPGICHIDGTSRIQTVTESQHPGLHRLLMKWYESTGCPMLINTSLNIKNQPLVNDVSDAVEFSKLYNVEVLIR